MGRWDFPATHLFTMLLLPYFHTHFSLEKIWFLCHGKVEQNTRCFWVWSVFPGLKFSFGLSKVSKDDFSSKNSWKKRYFFSIFHTPPLAGNDQLFIDIFCQCHAGFFKCRLGAWNDFSRFPKKKDWSLLSAFKSWNDRKALLSGIISRQFNRSFTGMVGENPPPFSV